MLYELLNIGVYPVSEVGVWGKIWKCGLIKNSLEAGEGVMNTKLEWMMRLWISIGFFEETIQNIRLFGRFVFRLSLSPNYALFRFEIEVACLELFKTLQKLTTEVSFWILMFRQRVDSKRKRDEGIGAVGSNSNSGSLNYLRSSLTFMYTVYFWPTYKCSDDGPWDWNINNFEIMVGNFESSKIHGKISWFLCAKSLWNELKEW